MINTSSSRWVSSSHIEIFKRGYRVYEIPITYDGERWGDLKELAHQHVREQRERIIGHCAG